MRRYGRQIITALMTAAFFTVISLTFYTAYTAVHTFMDVPLKVRQYIAANEASVLADADNDENPASDAAYSQKSLGESILYLLNADGGISRIIIFTRYADMNTKEYGLKLKTLPLDTKITLNDDVYPALAALYPKIPKQLTVSSFEEYVKDSMPAQLTAVLERQGWSDVGVGMDYVIRQESSETDSLFTGDEPYNFTEDVYAWLDEPFIKKDTYNVLKKFYSGCSLSLELTQKLAVAEIYETLRSKNVTFGMVAGTYSSDGYEPDVLQSVQAD
jgi:hypothetical protein